MLFPVLSTLKLAMLLHGSTSARFDKVNSSKGQCAAIWTETDSKMKCCVRMTRNGTVNASKKACHLHIDFQQTYWPKKITQQIDHANANDANFEVIIERWNGSSIATSELFNALRLLKVVALDIRPTVTDQPIEMQNLGLFFPTVQKLTFYGPANGRRPVLIGATFLRDLSMLKALKASNMEFSLSREESQWCATIERLDFENCSFGADVLPHWMPKCRRVERISLTNCGLRSALQLAHIGSALQIRAKNNKIGDLHKVSFECTRLAELHLRDNEIAKIGAHTLVQCHLLRFLDLSDNPMFELPDKLFQGCRRLKELRLERLGLRSVRAELFLGLNSLKSLSLSGNPLSRIDPFTFLPTRSIHALRLDNCTLAQIPLAVTQCCLLDSLSMDDNRFATRNSMPAPLLALLPRLSHLSFARNPLLQLPWALFLYEYRRAEDALLKSIVNTLIKLPVWRLEPCTPYLWHFHLRNASSVGIRRRMSAWNELRMHRDGLAHCGQLYETIIEGIGIYRELRENNGCEATRRLRSVRTDTKNAMISCDEQAQIKTHSGNLEENWQQSSHANNIIDNVPPIGSTVGPRAFAYDTNDDHPHGILLHLWTSSTTYPTYQNVPETTEELAMPKMDSSTTVADQQAKTSLIPTDHNAMLSLSLGINFAIMLSLFLLISWKAIRWIGRKRRGQMREEFEEIR